MNYQHADFNKLFEPAHDVNSIREAFNKLAEQLTRDTHSEVVMTETTLCKVARQHFGQQLEPGGAHKGDVLYGMRLHTQKTMVGAEFKALLLACMEGRSVLLVHEDGHADTVRYG